MPHASLTQNDEICIDYVHEICLMYEEMPFMLFTHICKSANLC